MATDYPGEHESPLRQAAAEAEGKPYTSFASLIHAKADPHGAVIFEGDDGGQIYLAVPASVVECTEAQLVELLLDLDFIAWPGNDAASRRLVYERVPEGSGVLGGMGGGLVDREVWVHPDFEARGIADEIRAVLRGRAGRLSHNAIHGKRRRRR